MASRATNSCHLPTASTESYPQNNGSMIESCMIIWLDSTIDEESRTFQTCLNELNKVIFGTVVFKNADKFFNYINAIDTGKVSMIVSSSLSQSIIKRINDTKLLETVYVLSKNIQTGRKWARKIAKVKHIYDDINMLCKDLITDRRDYEKSTIPITFNTIDPTFMYTQILKDVLLSINDNIEHSLTKFARFCESLSNINMLELNQFVEDYHKHSAIFWYTKESFIYSMVNCALRNMDFGIIESMAFFIRDLHMEIFKVYHENHRNDRKIFQLYRGQGLSVDAFEKLRLSSGSLLSFNNFLSTSRSHEVSLEFSRRGASRDHHVGILFQITIDPDICDKSNVPYASVADYSVFGNQEEEILFSTHTIFRISSIKLNESSHAQNIYSVNIILVGCEDHEFRRLTESIRDDVDRSSMSGWFRFGYVLLKLCQNEKALNIFRKLLHNARDDSEEHQSAFYMGYACTAMGNYPEALKYYHKAITIKRKSVPEDDDSLASSYENIGLVYSNMGNYTKALYFYEKSLQIKKRSLPEYHSDFNFSYVNIASLYFKIGKYKDALTYYHNALVGMKRLLPNNHPDIAAALNNIGETYRKISDYDKALEFYERSLEIMKKSLPENHPDLANSYMNMGSVYYSKSDYHKALEYNQRSLQMKATSLPPNHPDLATSYMNLGSIYCSLSNYSKALKCHEKSIEIKKQSLTQNHPDLATSYFNIGLLLDAMGKYAESLVYLKKSLDIWEKILPTDHPYLFEAKKDFQRVTLKVK